VAAAAPIVAPASASAPAALSAPASSAKADWPAVPQVGVAQIASAAAAAPAAAALQPVPAIAPPSELVIDGQTVRVASPGDTNEIDLAAKGPGTPSDAPSPAAGGAKTASADANADTTATTDKTDSAQSVASLPAADKVGGKSWLLQVMAAVGGAVAAGSVAWFLMGSAPQRTYG
jgi:hypothetical protein